MHKTTIDANKNPILPKFRELYQYRDLFLTLTWRDFRVRYAQTTIGFVWAILQPVVTLLILSLVFGRFVGVETDVPHILFTVAGMGKYRILPQPFDRCSTRISVAHVWRRSSRSIAFCFFWNDYNSLHHRINLF